ncbi:MAG: phosphorylated adapter RNA export RNA-binding domain-containing protein [Anaerolineae bacterium]|nr:phosphorylated adapter RNA export RNA-binding domain-containing protein [Anaerolineae bacterium]MDW8170909.1 phosphorylated adapter RNA export RNA-binding domain-containing protein [Anaerolineae bacterium]
MDEEHPLQDAASSAEAEPREDEEVAQNAAEGSDLPSVELAVVSEANKRIAREFANILREVEAVPIQQIGRIIEVMGESAARELLAETLKVEEQGGMMTNSGDRRRTPGGVFFYLAKGRLTPEQRGRVFPHLAPRHFPSLSWEDRHEHVQALLASEARQPRLRTAVIQIRGFVTEWKQVDHTVILKMVYAQRSDIPLPRAVPAPPADTTTTFIVYIGQRHWEKVQKAIRANSYELVIEGIPFLDQETNSLAVMAMFASSDDMMPKERRDLIGEYMEAEMAPKPTRQEQKRLAEAKKAEAARVAGAKTSPLGSKIPAVKPIGKQPKTATTSSSQPAKPSQEAVGETATSAAPVIALPLSAPADVAAKIQQLQQAAQTLRERIATMEAKKQPGVAMTRKLLENTEKQIETLVKQYS